MAVSDVVSGVQNATEQCFWSFHLLTKLVLSSIPTHNNPVGLSLETWLANGGDRNVRSIAQENDRSGNL
jgi:predicted Zn-dependent protease